MLDQSTKERILRNVFARLSRYAVVVALVVSTGGHWFALQSVAWFTMTVQFVQSDPLDVALKKTFDGNHPCTLCKTVEKGRKAEREQTQLKVTTKLDLFLDREIVQVPETVVTLNRTGFTSRDVSRNDPPPTPPPRVA